MTGPKRIAILGDIHGHYTPLVACLERLGVDVHRKRWPADLTVVQVGDLIHRGPESDATVALVELLIDVSDGRWAQLIGNHEAQYLGGPQFWPHDELLPTTVNTLRHWHGEGLLRLAVALSTPEHGDVIVSHGGITAGWWRDALGAPHGAAVTAASANRLLADSPEVALTAGTMLTGVPVAMAGPAWAHPLDEVATSWTDSGIPMPWNQVHGHVRLQIRSGVRSGRWFVPHHPDAAADAHHTHVAAAGKTLMGVDPGLGRRAERDLIPLVLHGHVTEAIR